MLYQSEVGHASLDEAIAAHRLLREQPLSDDADAFAERLARGTATSLEAVDPLITEAAQHWRLERMAVLDRLILRLAVFEFLHVAETPPAVVIDEAIELAKRFGSDDSAGFVNGILDAIKRRLEVVPGPASAP